MKRFAAIGLAALLATGMKAQVEITVREAGSHEPVGYAHATWTVLQTQAKGLTVAGPEGKCTLPVHQAEVEKGLAVRIDFIGYEPVRDTLFTLAPRTFMLRRAAAFNLDELVVTGQYKPTRADRAVQRMHVVNAEQIQRMAAQNLGDVLGQELNMRLAQDNMLGTSLSMRGLGGENVKILVDGVPVIGRQDGNLDLAQIDLTGIDRVEILEGPLSVNYGTNALAGTINLITRKGTGPATSLKAVAYAEQIGRLNLSAAAGKRFGKSDLLLTLGRNYFGGWAPGQASTYAFGKQLADSSRYQTWKPREQYFARANYRFDLSKEWSLSYKGELMEDRIIDRGRPRAPYNESAFDSEFNTRRLDNAVFTTANLAKGRRFNALVAHDRYQRIRSQWLRDLTTLQAKPVPGQEDDSRFTLTNVRATFSGLPDSARIGYEAGMDLNLETGEGVRIADGTPQQIGDYAAFASMQWSPVGNVVLRPGARYAHNTRYRAPVVPSVDLRLQLDTAWVLRAAYAQGFRAPSLKELFLYFVDVNHDIHGNPDLLAENSNNYSLSLNYRKPLEHGILRGEASLYHDRVHNLITLAEESATLYRYINVGEYRTLGGSIGMGWESGHWSVQAGGALTGRYDTLGVRTGGDAYDHSPSANLGITRHWRKQAWSINLFAKYQGRQQSYIYVGEDELARGHIEPYLMADASVSKSLWNNRLTVQAGCKNLLDITDLNAMVGNGGAHTGPSSGSIPMATGRTFFIRLAADIKGKSKLDRP
ncbi:MAG TPA: TonB-dependent receptor [Flavobacteriales bacterium]|nr:TonB-dependent receptor [Flavobacteriales bacterium]HRP80811.1 TonB-dependent receptor [Flavobacteriales bacterium]